MNKMNMEDRIKRLEDIILGKLVVNKEAPLEKILLSQGLSEEKILDMQKQMIDYMKNGWLLENAKPVESEPKKIFTILADWSYSQFKSWLDTAWFDRSGDTNGIAVGTQNEIKYANADDFEAKNPRLFQKMYEHYLLDEDDPYNDHWIGFSWESKLEESK